jgi:NADH-quinone oxidoreductase subunit J
LSVCTGLISVLFISTISLTYPLSQEEKLQHMHTRMQRFRWLPFLAAALGIGLSMVTIKLKLPAFTPQIHSDMRLVMWDLRPLEIFGQVVILLSGAFGVIILFKEAGKK